MEYPCGTLIEFNDGTSHGVGKIVGVATISQPAIGRSFIVEHISGKPSLPNDTYPYSHRIVLEVHIGKPTGVE